jgi:cytosine/adenosine deaminase-related metal-dependent hydrolase
MNVIDTLASRNAQWAIVDTLYFDSATHAFHRADLEIDGSRIARILAPKSSRRTDSCAGHDLVCIPGLIDPDTGMAAGDWREQSMQLARCGITTAGTFCADAGGQDAGEAQGIRRVLYVELGEARGTPCAGLDVHALREFEARIENETSDMRVLLPAIVPAQTWSAATLCAVAALAERHARQLCVRLTNTKAVADHYRETRYFTEIGLLSYLSLLGARTTVFELSQLSRRDAGILRGASASLVCAGTALSETASEPHWANLSLDNRSVGLAVAQDALADLNRYASLLIGSMTFMHRSESVTASCDALVDALTCAAAGALGLRDIGAIAPGMKADLCLFERPADFHSGGDSLHLIKLLVSRRPRHVLVDGLPVVINRSARMTPAPARALA